MLRVSPPAADLDADNADHVGLVGLPPRPSSIQDLYAAEDAYAGLGAMSPQAAEIVKAVLAAMAATMSSEPTSAGDRIMLRPHEQAFRPDMYAEWPYLPGERQAGRGGLPSVGQLFLTRPSALPTDGQMCAVFAVDIVGFTRPDRDDDIRRYLHERLYEYLPKAFGQCGIPWGECFCEDRGDGALIVVPPEIPVKGLIGALPGTLRSLIRLHNHVSSTAADMQLRLAVHVGPIDHDGHGFIGSDVNFAFRMLDARPLKSRWQSGRRAGRDRLGVRFSRLVCRYPAGPPGRLSHHPVPGQEHPGPGLDVPARHGALRVVQASDAVTAAAQAG